MKKNIFLIFLLFFSIQNNAQLPNGSIAPDFTATDINGNQHTLSNYLNSGKTVILEFSSTHCGASWKYLRTEALQDFYNAYGLPGSNEIVVLFIEHSSTLLPLQGISNPPGFCNWTEKTPFPMILNPGLHSLYQINFEPTIYKICPNGIISPIGQPSASTYRVLADNCSPILGIQNHAKVIDNINGFCSSSDSFKAKLKNYGTNTITSATLKLKENGVVISTKTFNTNIPQFSVTTLEFDPININESATYSTELESVNGNSIYNSTFKVANLPFSISNTPSSLNLLAKVHTYSCPNNMSWKITNSSGVTVANGGPYGIPGSSCNGPSNSIVEHNISLLSGDCYNLILMDSNGFGWKNYSGNSPVPTNAGIEFFSNGSLFYSKMNVENFGYSQEIKNFINTQTLSLSDNEISKINVYPNPVKDILYLDNISASKATIYSLLGQQLEVKDIQNTSTSIDMSKYEKGIYLITLENENKTQTIKVIKE